MSKQWGMMTRRHIFNNSPQNGFSLIELMLVISIMTLLVGMALPNIAMMQIKAARAEFLMNAKTIFSAAHAHHAENGVFPNDFTLGMSTTSGVTTNSCAPSNELGISMQNCDKLRYQYGFSGTGGTGNGVDASRQLYFTITGTSYFADITGLGGYIAVGSQSPTNFCKQYISSTYVIFFHDRRTMFDNGYTQTYLNLPNEDAVKRCFP